MKDSVKAEIPAGHIEKVNFRMLEYYSKCPMKYLFNSQVLTDLTPIFWQAMDQTIAHASLKLIVAENLTGESLQNQFLKRLNSLVNKHTNTKNLILEQHQEAIIEKGYKLLNSFLDILTYMYEGYIITNPSFFANYSNYGIEVEITTHFSIKRKAKGPSPIEHIILDYSKTTKNWNTPGKLWAWATKNQMVERGVGIIDVRVLNLENKKSIKLRSSSKTMASHIMNNLTKTFAAKMFYPVFGNHCYSCLLQDSCSEACNY